MAVTTNTTKYFYPPRPGSGAATFSDNIVGLQTVEGGGLTQGNFEFTTSVLLKVEELLRLNLGFILIMMFLKFLISQCMVHYVRDFKYRRLK